MTAATLAPADRKTRMQLIINLAISGSYDAGICPCGEDECIHVEDARKALDNANRAIDRAPRDDAALAIYSEGWFRAAGIPEDEWSVTTAGNGGDSNG